MENCSLANKSECRSCHGREQTKIKGDLVGRINAGLGENSPLGSTILWVTVVGLYFVFSCYWQMNGLGTDLGTAATPWALFYSFTHGPCWHCFLRTRKERVVGMAFCLGMPCGADSWICRLLTPVFPRGRGDSDMSFLELPFGCQSGGWPWAPVSVPRDSQTLLFLPDLWPDSSERSASISYRFRAVYHYLRWLQAKPASRTFWCWIFVLRNFKSHHQICPSDHVMYLSEIFSEKAHTCVRVASFNIA